MRTKIYFDCYFAISGFILMIIPILLAIFGLVEPTLLNAIIILTVFAAGFSILRNRKTLTNWLVDNFDELN